MTSPLVNYYHHNQRYTFRDAKGKRHIFRTYEDALAARDRMLLRTNTPQAEQAASKLLNERKQKYAQNQ